MIQRLLYQYWFKAILIALIALILYGVFPGSHLAVILVIFVVLRCGSIAVEALRKLVSPERYEAMQNELTRQYEKLTAEERTRRAVSLHLDSRLSARELADAQVSRARLASTSRPKRELCAELLGVVGFAILLPLDYALYTRDFFSIRTMQGWEGAAVAAFCIILYLWPYHRFKSPDSSDIRIWWWSVPFVAGFLALNHAIETRHPYLNPFDPNHNRLAAERVLSLKNNIVAGYHADWVLRYARKLDEQGQTQAAIHFYQETLRLDAGNREASARLAQLEAQSGLAFENGTKPSAASAPYWTAEKPIVKQPRRMIDPQLDEVEGCAVVVIAVGEISDALLDSVGYVIHNELDLPVYISPETAPLPTYTRRRGLATGPQWSEMSIVKALNSKVVTFPKAPIKYVVLTPADIYVSENENFVFSATYPWGCVVSSARLADSSTDESLGRARVSKQALCALLKSYGIRPSADRNCVTSYTRSLQEFDAKGNRPDAETMLSFQNALALLNSQWQQYKATPHIPAK